jgi:DNA-binding protein YbaB
MTSQVDRAVHNARKHRELYEAMIEQCQSISVRVTSRDRSVSAEANGLGSLTGLWLAPSASRLDPKVLAGLIVETTHGAAQVATKRYSQILEEFTSRMRDLQHATM